jgi:hypothetical protein
MAKKACRLQPSHPSKLKSCHARTGARLRHNPAVAQNHPDPPVNACNPHMLHWETQLCAVADPGMIVMLMFHVWTCAFWFAAVILLC